MGDPAFSLRYWVLRWIVSALAIVLTSKLMSRFRVKGFGVALIAALVIGLANYVVWPILIILTLPINILTLGLFTFVVNGAVLKLSSAVIPGFQIEGWGTAILGSIVLSIVNMVLHYVLI